MLIIGAYDRGGDLIVLAGAQLPLNDGKRQVVPSERVMHSMTTRSFRMARAETPADTMDIGADRVYPSKVFS